MSSGRSLLQFNLSVQGGIHRGIPGLMAQTLWGGRGYHKELDLHRNPWSESSSFRAKWRCSQEHEGNRPELPYSSSAEEYGTFYEL
ncbi:hypothetical protein TNCV_1244991 [Trichonephila clavipes]|nr:hypothetical protein TNCV_1244991 [Trichonephila clavipes]